MNRTGYRRGVPLRFENGDLARKAVVVGAVLAAAVVFFAALTAVWGPSGPDSRPTNSMASYLAWPMAKQSAKSLSAKRSDDESDSDDGSDSDSDSDSGGDSDHDSGEEKKKGGSSSRKSGGSSKSKSSSADSDTDSGSSSGGSSSSGSSSVAPGIGPTGRSSPSSTGIAPTGATPVATRTGVAPSGPAGVALAQVSCTKQVTDEAGLKEALASAAPHDVICVKGNVGRSSAASPTPTPGASPPSGSSTSSRTLGPVSSCGPDATCTQTNRSSGSSTRSTATPSSSTSRPPARPSKPSSSGTTSSSTGTVGGSSGGEASPASTGGPPGAATPAQDNCTKQVDGSGLSETLAAAAPGERICVTGDMSGRLEVKKSGTEQAPIQIIGNGQSVVKGITVDASHVLVEGFQVLDAQAPGIQITGDGITVRNNTVKRPTGGDFDGLRFFGNNIKILHNTISDINPGGGGAHADCMQTFTSDRPSSEHVLIDGNKCENIKNICLMAEGPGDVGDGGGGDGTSANWTISNNYCEFGAAQGIMIEAVQNVTIKNNEFAGDAAKAIGLDIGSTGATVSANLLGDGVKAEVGMDTTSKKGYQGPQPQGGP